MDEKNLLQKIWDAIAGQFKFQVTLLDPSDTVESFVVSFGPIKLVTLHITLKDGKVMSIEIVK